MNITIDSDAMNAALQRAVLDTLGAQGQETILKHAVEKLLTAQTSDGYGRKNQPSPLVQAINEATIRTANRLVSEWLDTNEEFKAQVHALMQEAWQKLLADQRETIAEKMAVVLREAVTGSRY